ncbi:MAG: hypothetical protein RMX96_34905 [Nostoc sp. ChiSLP02]|nr:hypothetical protein [Nostoc sp. DedSLP05]MDZ8101560.1 hypothetical protein [Nostoc sp. DedSLP01]MDZ8190013.1 hypothetical protein [Nostoc sp. ChiSLP02]
MYCTQSNKGKIFFFQNGKKEVLEIPSSFDISCSSQNSACGLSGTYTFSYTTPAPNPIGTMSFASFSGETWYFKSKPAPSTTEYNQGLSWDLYANCAGAERLVYSNFSILSGHPIVLSSNFVIDSSANKYLRVTNASGQLIAQLKADNCNFDVACSEDCPAGKCKCATDSYPGYCCLDCAATAANIKAITNELRANYG